MATNIVSDGREICSRVFSAIRRRSSPTPSNRFADIFSSHHRLARRRGGRDAAGRRPSLRPRQGRAARRRDRFGDAAARGRWIAYHGAARNLEPHVAPSPLTLIVLVVVVAMKESCSASCCARSATVDSSAVETDAWHHRSDAITSVAAVIGISISLVGGTGLRGGRRLGGDCGGVRHRLERLAAAAAGVQRIDGHARPTAKLIEQIRQSRPDHSRRGARGKILSSARWAISFSWTCTWRWTRR